MELIKKNIHMDRIKCRSNSQVTLEEDINIPDSKPDVAALIYEKGQVQIEEVKPTEDHVNIRGRLLFSVLYQTREEGQRLVCVEGKIPFEEQLYMEGVRGTDAVTVKAISEDLTVGMINSRKLSVQALFSLKAWVEELYDEEAPVDIYFEEMGSPLEYRKVKRDLAEIAIQKNDIFRIREEINLPQNYPNIFHIIWDDVTLEEVEFKPLAESISIQGDVRVFVLYEGEGEEMPIRTYETVIPFSGTVECHGCRDTMIADIGYEIGHRELEVRPDFDGEERMLGLEMVLDIVIKLYEEESVEMISDIYGVTKEVESIDRGVNLKQLLMKIGGKSKVTDRMKVKNPGARVLQLLHSEGSVQIDNQEITPDGILIEGTVAVQVMYITGDDASPYNCMKGMIPFSYTLEVPGISPSDSFKMRADAGHLQVVMIDSEEMDVKAVLDFQAVVFRNVSQRMISDIRVSELDMAKVNDLPGMVVYVVQQEDNLWNIGKRYYVPVERIKEVNELSTDEVRPGDKLLLVKGL
ncbi:MAG: SPOCS domain-containing protein [Lachnospiraceae bacterium]